MTLIEFLTARLGEDEEVALGAAEAGHERSWFVDGPAKVSGQFWVYATGEKFQQRPTAEHIARHDPARVLREVAAKRALLDEHGLLEVASLDTETRYQTFIVCRRCATQAGRQIVHPCPTLRSLAAVYRDHPDYREDWA